MTEPTDKPQRDAPAIDDEQLDEYLRGNSSVSRQYRQLHDVEVPADLDRLVLRRAHDAVKRRSSQRPAWVRWSAPLAVAASAVLALAIVIETGVRDETMVMSEPQPVMQAEKFAGSNVEEKSAAEAAAPAAESSSEVTADVSRQLDAPVDTSAEDRLSADARGSSQRAEIPPAAPPPQKETSLPQRVRSAAPVEEMESQSAIAQSRRAAPPPVAAPANAPAAAPVTSAAPTDAPAAPAFAPEPGQSVAKAAQSAARVLQTSARVDDEREQRAAVSYRTYTDPEEWLKDIRQLRKDDKQAQADLEWHRFLATFPNYEVAEGDAARAAKQ